MYRRVNVLRLISIVLLSSLVSACAIPRSKDTFFNISARIIDEKGNPVSGEKVEVVLPAAYGLSDLDQDFGSAESYGQSDLRHTVRTDASGTFTCSFAPIRYSAATYILPPLGSFPRRPPRPLFYLRFENSPGWYYAVKIEDSQVVYGVYDEHDYLSLERVERKPLEIDGQLLPDERGDLRGWIADMDVRYLSRPSRARLSPAMD